MKRGLTTLVLCLGIGVAAYTYREPIRVFATQLYSQVAPCTKPLTYSIGAIDSRFNVTREAVRESLERAASVWNDESERLLLSYVPTGGGVIVNFIYDDRQQTTTKLQSLGISIADDREAFDTLNAQHKKLVASYEAAKRGFESESAALKRDTDAYESDVARINARGGATPGEYEQLQVRKSALLARQEVLVAKQKALNADASDLNAMVQTLNRLAQSVNTGASAYNEAAEDHDEEFQEAVFQSAPGKQEINVFEFDSSTRLERVLAHEFGHALGLEHVQDQEAIMYRLNQGASVKATSDDVAELRTACRISA